MLDIKVLTFFMGKAVGSNNLTGKQNSGLVNFILESHLPLAQSVPFIEKWLQKLETGIINMSLNKWNSLKMFTEI